MNTSSRVPGITRNSGWQAIDAEIAARRVLQQQNGNVPQSGPKRGSSDLSVGGQRGWELSTPFSA